jgi:membrane protease YdiL (CAAX protease family)
VGFDIVLQNILPSFILDMYNKLLENYSVMTELAKLQNDSVQEFLIVSSCIAIIPGVCEEFLFRGYLMQGIALRNSKLFAICISAMIFAFIHIFPNAWIPIFLIGIFLGKLFYSSNSIMPPILLHFANNFFGFISANYCEDMEQNSKNVDL